MAGGTKREPVGTTLNSLLFSGICTSSAGSRSKIQRGFHYDDTFPSAVSASGDKLVDGVADLWLLY